MNRREKVLAIAFVLALHIAAPTAQIRAGLINLATMVTGDLPFANLTQGSALSVLGVTGNSTADVASIAAGSDAQVLRRSGTSLAFGTVATDGHADDSITNAKLANMAESTIKCRAAAAGTGDPTDCSATQVRAIVGMGANYTFAMGGQNGAVVGVDPNDATTYLFGDRPAYNAVTGTNETLRVTMPKAGTAKIAYGSFVVLSTLASAGSSTIALENRTAGTSQTITSSLALTSARNTFNNTSLTLAFSAGDELEVSWLTPTWTTNPLDVVARMDLYVEFN